MSMKDHFSANVMSKARAVPADAVTQMEEDPTIFLVESQRTGKKVQVQLLFEDGKVMWRTCTCTNGNKRGGQAECYHAARAEMHYLKQTDGRKR